MNKAKNKLFQTKKITVMLSNIFLFSTIGISLGMSNVYAQEASPEMNASIANNPNKLNTTFQQQNIATNPFGSINGQNAPTTQANVQYNPNDNNINGNKQVVVPMNVNNETSPVIINPALAQQQAMRELNASVPQTTPQGLPSNVQYAQQQMNAQNIDPTQATINILNTPNNKIQQLKKDLYDKGRVINQLPVVAPRPINGILTASLSPGSISPVIRLSQNTTSTIMITDMAGNPWPIVNYDGLPNSDFKVQRLDAPSPKGCVLGITPKGAFVSGNLVLILKDEPVPININFVSAQKDVDVTTQIRIQAQGPNTQLTSINLPPSVDSALLSVLQGVAPGDAKELTTSSPAVQAWLAKDGSMYVRTRYKIMSPAFENVTSSPDGTYAYKMVPVPVVLYKVADGRFGEFTVNGF
jgi:hypothetical protein